MKDTQPLPTAAVRPGRWSELGQGRGRPRSLARCGASPSRPVGPGGDSREQLLLYVLGEKLQLKVGEGNFPRVLPLLKILLQHFLVICFRRSKRMGCWL